MRASSEYEIFVNLESDSNEVGIPSLVKSLKRQISYIHIESPIEEMTQRTRKNSEKQTAACTPPICGQTINENNVFESGECIDTDNTSVYNLDGVLVRKSKSYLRSKTRSKVFKFSYVTAFMFFVFKLKSKRFPGFR
jgi:hypothetical protein